MTIHYLYKITNNTSSKSYIGVTIDPRRRKTDHLGGNGSRLIAKDLKDDLVFELLVAGSERYIYDLEKLAIDAFDTLYPKGYNLGLGGEGGNATDRRGTKNTQALLSESQVLEIRYLAASGELHKDLATKFNVTRETISTLVRGDSWKEIGGPTSRRKTVCSDDIALFQELLNKGLDRKQIAMQTGWSYNTVYKYLK